MNNPFYTPTFPSSPLDWEEILSVYKTKRDHSWPFNTPPYLYFESRYQKNDSCWIAWRDVMHIVEGGIFGYTPRLYNESFRIWPVKPIDSERSLHHWRRHEKEKTNEIIC